MFSSGREENSLLLSKDYVLDSAVILYVIFSLSMPFLVYCIGYLNKSKLPLLNSNLGTYSIAINIKTYMALSLY